MSITLNPETIEVTQTDEGWCATINGRPTMHGAPTRAEAMNWCETTIAGSDRVRLDWRFEGGKAIASVGV